MTSFARDSALNRHTTATSHCTKFSLPVNLTEAHPSPVFWSVLSRTCFKKYSNQKRKDEAKTWQNLSDFGIWVMGRQRLVVPLHVFKTLYYVWKCFQPVYTHKLTFLLTEETSRQLVNCKNKMILLICLPPADAVTGAAWPWGPAPRGHKAVPGAKQHGLTETTPGWAKPPHCHHTVSVWTTSVSSTIQVLSLK